MFYKRFAALWLLIACITTQAMGQLINGQASDEGTDDNRILTSTASDSLVYPPAPFILWAGGYPWNTTLYRMDHVGGCPGNGVEKDQPLFLHWQVSKWRAPYESRNDSTDTIRYELNVIIDSVGASSSKQLVVSFPAGSNPFITLKGDEVYEKIFRPPVPWPLDPDTIVMRVNWYVRAYNRIGSTYSDTAGVTNRQNPMPALPLVLSYNRPPQNPPTPVTPLHKSVITGINASTPPLNIIWTPATDRNINAGIRSGGFKVFNPATRTWIDDPEGRTVDTLIYQWVGTVVHTARPGKGAPIGTIMVRNCGYTNGFQLSKADISTLFGGFSDDTSSTSADTVVIDWRVYMKDYAWYGDGGQEEVTFRYKTDGTLVADTAKFSRFGCRPHELVSDVFRFTLVKDRTNGIEPSIHNASSFSLSRNYPNPVNHATTISFHVPSKSFVRLTILDALGREVAALISQEFSAGNYGQYWNAEGLPGGVYFYRLQAGAFTETRKMVLVR